MTQAGRYSRTLPLATGAILLSLILQLCLQPLPVKAQAALSVVYPKADQTLGVTDSTFVFGSTTLPGAQVFINGHRAQMYPQGRFMGFVPVRGGAFTFRCVAATASDSLVVERHVHVPRDSLFLPAGTVAVDMSSILPADNVLMSPGGTLEVSFRGASGLRASFAVEGLAGRFPIVEGVPAGGAEAYWGNLVFGDGRPKYALKSGAIYSGAARIPVGADLDSAKVRVDVADTTGVHKLSLTAPGSISTLRSDGPVVGTLTEEMTVARTGPGLGYLLFLPRGVRLRLISRRNGFWQARLAPGQSVWVPAGNLKRLPGGTPAPRSTISVVRTESRRRAVLVKLFLQEKLPFRVRQSTNPSALTLSVYGAVGNTDWIRQDIDDDMIEGTEWQQPQEDIYQLQIRLHGRQQWGYRVYFDGNTLTLALKRPPARLSLKKMVVCLDPGHAPLDGAIGPSGVTEKDANLWMAEALAAKLRRKGATVFLTRSSNYGATLSARTRMAEFVDADLFVSLHFNALPDGVNPFRNRGTSTFYYHPQSRALAASIQRALLKRLRLPDFGLYYDNLAVCRLTSMPSVLVEPAFIMHPTEEALILDKNFREQNARAIVKGIEQFLKGARK